MKTATWVRLFFEVAAWIIRLALEILVLLGRLTAFVLRELLIPLVCTAAEGLVGLAGRVAVPQPGHPRRRNGRPLS